MDTPHSIGPFELRRELGRGASGVVYQVYDAGHDRLLALKLYGGAAPAATGAIGRLKRDAQAAGALGHPNIAAVLAVGEHLGQPWVASELVEGVSLAQVARSRSPWPIESVLDVWRQLCEGLAHAHREGVLHLDLKPADVRVTPAGEVKVLDFGSWHLKALERQGPGPADNGLHYRAPEVVAGRRPDQRADVFAAAAIVFELVARCRAFPGETASDVMRALSRCEPEVHDLPPTPFSPGFERILARGLARSPEERHASFEEVHADLVQLVRDTAPRLRAAARAPERLLPEREGLVSALTRARAEERLDDALDVCEQLLTLDPQDVAAQCAVSEIESVLVERKVDALVGSALAHSADGELALAAEIAERVERLAPWSPRYLQLQVYLDEEKARIEADAMVATGRRHADEGRAWEARAAARNALALHPGHAPARKLLDELGPEEPSSPLVSVAPARAEPVVGVRPESAAEPALDRPRAPVDPRAAQAEAQSAAALRHFLADEHVRAREAVERALALDPSNRRALDLQKILRVLG